MEFKDVREAILKNKKLQHDKSQEFLITFGTPLDQFMIPILGFDIVKFDDEVIKPPGGVCTKDAIMAQYGEGAVELIEALIE